MAIKNTTILKQASQGVSNLSVLSLGVSGFLLMFYASLLFAEPLSTESVSAESSKSSAHQPVKSNDKILTDVKSVQQEADAQVLYAEQWELARSGDSVLSLPVLSQVINTWLPDKATYNVGSKAESAVNAKKIEIQYPGGEEGELWVQQLTDWMVSLGIPSASIVLTPGSRANDIIKFDIIK